MCEVWLLVGKLEVGRVWDEKLVVLICVVGVSDLSVLCVNSWMIVELLSLCLSVSISTALSVVGLVIGKRVNFRMLLTFLVSRWVLMLVGDVPLRLLVV